MFDFHHRDRGSMWYLPYLTLPYLTLPIAREIFLDMFEIWCFQQKVESMKTPRCLINSFSFIVLLLILIVMCCFIGLL